ncbi:MAG: hypothetical protein V2I67_03465 [Thermoanaerobaculales bacterium]|jgi:tRNA nucleotidyltransferase (CCA-adding enzyme)|nr:hypothetical protein [Thermoanaerobaculales bacterium]
MTHVDPARRVRDPTLQRVWEQMGRPARCRVVGGWVRDRVLGRATGDLDLSFEGDAEAAAEPATTLAAALGTRAHLLGTAPHQVWRIDAPELTIELWPMGDLDHESDMARRDYACNALSWELPDGPLQDLVGGLADLRDQRLRAVSRSNLEDDPVRLLRAPRFLAQLEDFDLDERTAGWIRGLAPRLAAAPRERVGRELRTLLASAAPSRGLRWCLDLGLFRHAAPPGQLVDEPWLREHLNATDRLRGADAGASTIAGLAFLLRSWGVPSPGRLSAYAWPQTERDTALRAARFLDEASAVVDAPPADRRELAWRAGAAFPAVLVMANAIDPDNPGWRRWRRQWQQSSAALTHPRPLLSGTEIAGIAGIEPGPDLGALIAALTRAQVRCEVRTRSGAVRFIRSKVRSGDEFSPRP